MSSTDGFTRLVAGARRVTVCPLLVTVLLTALLMSTDALAQSAAAAPIPKPSPPAEPRLEPVMLVATPMDASLLRPTPNPDPAKVYNVWLPQPCDADEKNRPPEVVCGWSPRYNGGDTSLEYAASEMQFAWLNFESPIGTCDAWWEGYSRGAARNGSKALRGDILPAGYQQPGTLDEKVYGNGVNNFRIEACAQLGTTRLTVIVVGAQPLSTTRVYQEVAWMLNQILRYKASQLGFKLPPEAPSFSLKTVTSRTTASAKFTPVWVSPNLPALKVALVAAQEKSRLEEKAAADAYAAREAAKSQAAQQAERVKAEAAAKKAVADAANRVVADALAASIEPHIAPAPPNTAIRIRQYSVPGGVRSDKHTLQFDPVARIVPLPNGEFIENQSSGGQAGIRFMMKAAKGGDYSLTMYVDPKTCADYDREEVAWAKRSEDQHRKYRDFKLVEATPFDARWGAKYYGYHSSVGWGSRPPEYEWAFCMDGPSASVRLAVGHAVGATFDLVELAPFTKALADSMGPGTAALDTSASAWVSGTPHVVPVYVEDQFLSSLKEPARSCRSGGGNDRQLQNYSQMNCQLLEGFARLQRQCIQGIGSAPGTATCNAIAEMAVKEKDFVTAATYYQHACDLEGGRSCSRALDAKKKAVW